MQQILEHLIDSLKKGHRATLCAIIRNTGSAPRHSGARMLITDDGTFYGSVGGGAVEGACLHRAKELYGTTNGFLELNFDLTAGDAAESGMVCGGKVSILMQRIGAELLADLVLLQEQFLKGARPTLITLLPSAEMPPKMQFLGIGKDATIEPAIRHEVLRKPRRDSFLLEHQGRELLVEPLSHPGRLHIAGAGHVGMATAKIAAFVGFQVIVMDDREEFANSGRFPEATEVRVIPSFNACLKNLGPDDYVVIVTRGHLHDRVVLGQALRTDAGYIGMIGSKRKRDATYTALKTEGFTDHDFARVHSPIGLAIGADTPEEIALSIMAEVVRERAGIKE